MSTKTAATSSGSVVREWAVKKGLEVKQTRGRLPKAVIVAFNDEHPDALYAAGAASPRKSGQTTIPVVKRNARGARLRRPQTIPTSEVRTLAGAPATVACRRRTWRLPPAPGRRRTSVRPRADPWRSGEA